MFNLYKAIVSCQKEIYEKTGKRTDAYYKEGYGALFVPEFAELTSNNVIYSASEMVLIMRGM